MKIEIKQIVTSFIHPAHPNTGENESDIGGKQASQ